MWGWIDVHPVGAGVDNDIDKIGISGISEDYIVKGGLFKGQYPFFMIILGGVSNVTPFNIIVGRSGDSILINLRWSEDNSAL